MKLSPGELVRVTIGIDAGLERCRDTTGRPSPSVCHRNRPWYKSVRPNGWGSLCAALILWARMVP